MTHPETRKRKLGIDLWAVFDEVGGSPMKKLLRQSTFFRVIRVALAAAALALVGLDAAYAAQRCENGASKNLSFPGAPVTLGPGCQTNPIFPGPSPNSCFLLHRDLTANGPAVINVTCNSVTIDLGGHEVTQQAGLSDAIHVMAKDVEIVNGKVIGGLGIVIDTPSANVTLEDLAISAGAQGIHVVGPVPSVVIEQNLIVDTLGTGVLLESVEGGRVANNTIAGTNGIGARGIDLVTSRGIAILDNTIRDFAVGPGVHLRATSVDNSVARNTISRTGDGVRIENGSSNNSVIENSLADYTSFGVLIHAGVPVGGTVSRNFCKNNLAMSATGTPYVLGVGADATNICSGGWTPPGHNLP